MSSGEEPRIGVFVCNCGINIGGVVDVPGVQEYAGTLPACGLYRQNLFTCSQDTQDKIKEKIKEHKLNRVVVASCSPKTHAPMFMETLEACGLNKYLFEMANIRNQDSWVHANNPGNRHPKAKDLVRMAVARAGTLKPLAGQSHPGQQARPGRRRRHRRHECRPRIGKQGFEVTLVEKETELGGMARPAASHHRRRRRPGLS